MRNRSCPQLTQGIMMQRQLFLLCVGVLFVGGLSGCQQKMAEQPVMRPYSQSPMFANNQSARPLETDVVHRAQYLDNDPMVNWLTEKGRKPLADPEWKKAVDPDGEGILPAGVPNDIANFVDKFPFHPITLSDLERGQKLFNANCALCHGAAGHGNGKIAERGVLWPPSYHRDPLGKAKDFVTTGPTDQSNQGVNSLGNPRGSSRGFYRYGNKVVYLDEVPVGYIFQVITWGYGAMGSHAVQLADPKDRWRVIAYVRALQLSQGADIEKDLKNHEDILKKLNQAGGN